MEKIIKKLLYMVSILSFLLIAGCEDDIPEEITSLETSRLFSPTDLDVRVINQTSARLTWKR
jgi:hypothetical protein